MVINSDNDLLKSRVRSVPLPNSKSQGSSAIYVSSLLPIALDKVPKSRPQSPFQAFVESCKAFPNRPMLGHREINDNYRSEYKWLTYQQVLDKVSKFGLGLNYLLSPNSTTAINDMNNRPLYGICSRAQSEWLISDLAGQGYGMISVILYEDYSPDALLHVLKETKLSLVVCDLTRAGYLLKLAPKLPNLKTLVVLEPEFQNEAYRSPNHHLNLWAQQYNINLLAMEDVIQLGWKRGGMACLALQDPIPSHQLLTIAYTSGTTDLPKGVELTGMQFASILFSLSVSRPPPPGKEVYRFEYLPYAYIHPRTHVYYAISRGQSLGYPTLPTNPFQEKASFESLLDDIGELKPNVLPMVPSFLKSIHQTILDRNDKATTPMQQLFHWALNKRLETLRRANPNPNINLPQIDSQPPSTFIQAVEQMPLLHSRFEDLAFRSARQLLGGKLILITCGNHSLPSNRVEFLMAVLRVDIVQGYGATETCAMGFSTFAGETGPGSHVGGVVPLIQAKLVDCTELTYSVADKPFPRGEIWLRGPGLFKGYFNINTSLRPDRVDKNPNLTKDQWYPTGDIASLDPDLGVFTIIDRKANFFKLDQGIYITPEKIESAYRKLALVDNIYVPSIGGGRASAVVAVIVPQLREFLGWASYQFQRHFSNSELESLCQDTEVKTKFITTINRDVTAFKALQSNELVKAIHLEIKGFNNGGRDLVTPTNKLKRHHLKQWYHKEILDLYKELGVEGLEPYIEEDKPNKSESQQAVDLPQIDATEASYDTIANKSKI